MPYFSVLIPVYNVEKYLAECLNSVLSQSFNDFEVILVNDGSKDNSFKIAQEYCLKDERIKIINQENKGLFHTRQIAALSACGAYYIFIDSDDKWKADTLQIIYRKIKETNCDLVCFEKEKINSAGEIKNVKPLFTEEKQFNSKNKNEIFEILVKTNLLNSIWAKAFKATLLNFSNFVKYPRITMGEDLIYSANLIQNAVNIVYIKDVLYQYRTNFLSMSYNFKYNKEGMLIPILEIKTIIDKFYTNDAILLEQYACRYLKEIAVSCVYSFASIKGKEQEYLLMLKDLSDNELMISYYNQYENLLSFKVKFPIKLLINKKYKKIILIKKVMQKRCLNLFFRKLIK